MKIQEKLAWIQQNLKAPKSQNNDFGKYKYRSAEQILEAVKPLLQEAKLMILMDDSVECIGSRYYIKSTVVLEDLEEGGRIAISGYAREQEKVAGQIEAMVTGACSSYARKYALCGLFAIENSDQDPDSNAFQQTVKKAEANPHLSEAEAKDFEDALTAYGVNIPELMKKCKAKKMTDFTHEDSEKILKMAKKKFEDKEEEELPFN